MNLEQRLKKAILRECDKNIEKHHKYHNELHITHERNCERLQIAPPKEIKIPQCWNHDKKHNPFHVKKNANAIAKSIAKKIYNNTYIPNKPFIYPIKKAGGGLRNISVYQIPDNAVSLLFYSDLMSKNRHRFSSYSYAYRNDKNVHYAIQDISVDLSNYSRAFLAEFDFSDFFGSVNHDFLFSQLHKNGFLVSKLEENVIKAFLNNGDKGIPQGTSLSLFLANLICWRLDKDLESMGLTFARYADDTVILSQSYEKICEAYNAVDKFSRISGVPVNRKKSLGISLLTLPDFNHNELSSKESFNFLGYAVGVNSISARSETINKIKKQVSYLLYRNLIQPVKPPMNAGKLPSNRRDDALLIAMSQIRRYLYGGLPKRKMLSYIKNDIASIPFKGVLSFYPLINDKRQISEFEGWLVSTIYKSIQKRKKILISQGYRIRVLDFPFNVKLEEMVKTFDKVRIKNKRLLEIPSITLFYQAMERGVLEFGLEKIVDAESAKWDYE